MRRRQIAAQQAQEVTVTITQPMTWHPISEPTVWPDADGVIPGKTQCPKCGRVMKASGGATAHMRNCKGDV